MCVCLNLCESVCLCVCAYLRVCVCVCVCVCARAVRLIEIEIKSRFEIARFLNRFIARFFFCAPPQPPAVCYPNQSECSRTEQTGHTDRQYAKETGKMSSEQDKDLVAKKMHVACRAHSGE